MNISTYVFPSGITLDQCKTLWDKNYEYSLTTSSPSTWLSTAGGDPSNREFLKAGFNLTDYQIDLICDWILVSQEGWMRNIVKEAILNFNPLAFFGLVIPGGILIGYGIKLYRTEKKGKRLENSGKPKSLKKIDKK